MNSNLYFRLFPSCRLVEGVSSSIIADLDRGEVIDIPNLMYQVFCYNQKEKLTIEQLKKYFDNEYDKGIDKIVEFLLNKKLGFLTQYPDLFEDIDLNFETPYIISNAVVEYDQNSPFSLDSVVSILNCNGCQAIELRILGNWPEDLMIALLKKTNTMRIRKIDIVLKFSKDQDIVMFSKSLFTSFPRVGNVVFYSSPRELIKREYIYNRVISLISTDIESGFLEKKAKHSLVWNLTAYTEAQSNNLGLNKKVAINRYGKIKNYLSHSEEFGDVSNENILKFITNSDLQKIWKLPNDRIETCKACQYRYGCVDNSPVAEKNGVYYKENLCNFDPFRNNWI